MEVPLYDHLQISSSPYVYSLLFLPLSQSLSIPYACMPVCLSSILHLSSYLLRNWFGALSIIKMASRRSAGHGIASKQP